MKQYKAQEIINIALVGRGSSGMTSLAEAMIYTAGGTDRLGKVSDGNTVMDFDPEEIKRKASISIALAPVEWKGKKIVMSGCINDDPAALGGLLVEDVHFIIEG